MKTHTTKNAEHGLVGNVETSEANDTKHAKPFKCWLWPDRPISMVESRVLREEHNALVNSHYELLEACRIALADESTSSKVAKVCYAAIANAGALTPISAQGKE